VLFARQKRLSLNLPQKLFNSRIGFQPKNTISPLIIGRPTEKRKLSSLQGTASHASKRAKADNTSHFTEARLVLDDGHGIPRESVPNSQPVGSQRSTRSNAEQTIYNMSGVSEYRNVEDRHEDSRRRSRRQRSGTGKPATKGLMHRASVESVDPIGASDEESSRSGEQKTGHAKNIQVLDSADLALVAPTPRNRSRPQPSHPNHGQMYRRANRTVNHEDIDELALNYDPNGKPSTEPRVNRSPQSASLSTRGDMKRSTFGKKSAKNPIYDEGVSLQSAFWQPDCVYVANGHKGQCVLRSRNGIAGDDVLQLFDSEGQPVHDGWLVVESEKIQHVKTNNEESIVRITQPNHLDRGTGRLLYLQFPEPAAAKSFVEWVGDNTKVRPEADPSGIIVRQFTKSYDDISNRSRMNAARRASPTPDDVKLLGKRQESRQAQHHEELGTKSEPQPRKLRLIDGLQNSTAPSDQADHDDTQPQPQRRSTRQIPVRRELSPAELEPLLWTEKNPSWDKNWRLPLVYQRTMVEKDDIPRLDEGQCLNDNIIGFYLRHLYTELEKQHPETAKRVYFHNSFFYEKLKPTSSRHKINYEGVKNWTSKVDILSCDYIVVPVNEHYHWWVAIICNPGKLDAEATQGLPPIGQNHGDDDVAEVSATSVNGEPTEVKSSAGDAGQQAIEDAQPEEPLVVSDIVPGGSAQAAEDGDDHNGRTTLPEIAGKDQVVNLDDEPATTPGKVAAQQSRKGPRKSIGGHPRKYSPADPRIVTLDSLGSAHSPVCQHLKNYLLAEFKDKKNKDVAYDKAIGLRARNLPEQNNFTDCGVYLLKYVAKFLENPDKFIHGILQNEHDSWDIDPSTTRNEIRQLIFTLHDQYQSEQEAIKKKKALAKQKGRSKSYGLADGKSSVPPTSSAEPSVEPAPSQPDSDKGGDIAATRTLAPSRMSATHDARQPELDKPQSPQSLIKPSDPKVEAPKSSKPEPVQYEPRAFQVIDDQDTPGDKSTPIPVADTPSGASQPIPSIEVPDDDMVSIIPTQQPPKPALRQVSPGMVIPIGTDDKDVHFVNSWVASSAVKKRARSNSHAETSDNKRVRPDKLGSPDLSSDLPTRARAMGPAGSSTKSHYFGQQAGQARSPSSVTKKYGRAGKAQTQESARKVRIQQQPIDLTED
jgi:sentrin-specific protease 7